MANNALVLISSQDANDFPYMDVMLPGDWDSYAMFELVISNLSPTQDNGLLQMQYLINDHPAEGPYYTTMGYSVDHGGNGASGDWQSPTIHLSDLARVGALANYGISGKISLFCPAPGTGYTTFMSNIYAPVAYDHGGCLNFFDGAYQGSEGIVNGLRFQFGNEINMNTGTISLYGWLK